MTGASPSHNILHRCLGRISATGIAVLTGRAHLSRRAASCVAKLAAGFITRTDRQDHA